MVNNSSSHFAFDAIFNNPHIGLALVGQDGCWRRINQKLCEILDYDSAAALLGNCVSEVLFDVPPATFKESWGIYFAGDKTEGQFQWLMETANGNTKNITVEIQRIAEGNDLFAVLCCHDANQLVKIAEKLQSAREKAEQTVKMQQAFMTMMSHEFRTPLTNILGFTAVLRDEVKQEAFEFLDAIEESGLRLRQTVNGILDLARLEAKSVSISAQTVDFASVARSVVDKYRRPAEDQDLKINYQPSHQEITINFDAESALSVVTHLVDNAVKFSKSGVITIRLVATPDHTTFIVTDEGIGINPSFLPKAFEPFKQESFGLNRSYEGIGLGLAVVKRLTESAGGSVSLVSDLDQGTTVTLVFPESPIVAGEITATDAATNAEPITQISDKPAVLIVEDHQTTQLLLWTIFKKDYHVEIAHSADAALILALSKKFDLLIFDINLGDGLTGMQLLKRLHTDGLYLETPSIALTAYALPGDEKRILTAGFSSYMSKPFNPPDLLALAEQIR